MNNGSLASRASLAKVDGVLSQACFVDRFVIAKSLWDERGQKVDHEEEGSSFDCGDGCGKEPGAQAANGTTVRAEADECESQTFLGLDESAQSRKERRRVSKEGAGTVVAVVGASGGCGKSTIASLLASLCARAGLVTLAIDADLQFGDMHRMLGVREPVRMDEVVENPSLMTRLNEDAKSTGKPSLIAAPSRLESSEEIAGELPDIIDAARGRLRRCRGVRWRILERNPCASYRIGRFGCLPYGRSFPHRSKPRCMPLNYAHAWGLRRAVSFTRLTSTSVRACFLPLTHRVP